MERHEILDAMSELKLYGMRASFDEIAGKGLTRRDEIYPLIASLIRAERTHRQARSISYRISGARFPVLKDLDSFVFADTPLDQGQLRELATGAFLDAKRNAIFIGGTGTGKTHLCIAVACAVIRTRARGRFFNLVENRFLPPKRSKFRRIHCLQRRFPRLYLQSHTAMMATDN